VTRRALVLVVAGGAVLFAPARPLSALPSGNTLSFVHTRAEARGAAAVADEGAARSRRAAPAVALARRSTRRCSPHPGSSRPRRWCPRHTSGIRRRRYKRRRCRSWWRADPGRPRPDPRLPPAPACTRPWCPASCTRNNWRCRRCRSRRPGCSCWKNTPTPARTPLRSASCRTSRSCRSCRSNTERWSSTSSRSARRCTGKARRSTTPTSCTRRRGTRRPASPGW